MAQPLGPAQLYRAFPPKEQGTAFGILGIALVVAPALGPDHGWLAGGSSALAGDLLRQCADRHPRRLSGSRFLPDYQDRATPACSIRWAWSRRLLGSAPFCTPPRSPRRLAGPAATLLDPGLGIAVLVVHVVIELKLAPEPMMNLRLFSNRTFLNASMVGYVATVALFGAEFLMPVYLQSFRGRTALEAGVILLAVAATSAFTTPLAGRLYDRIGPRMIMFAGFLVLCINTWQLAQLQATTPISYVVFLLALRGLAVGLTLQTSYVTSLSSIPIDELPRGSSLLNSTRFVVQALSVAALATILVSFLSPASRPTSSTSAIAG